MKSIKNKSVISFLFISLTIILTSCSTVSAVMDVAGAIGVVDSNVAKSLSNTSNAIGKAIEDITPEQEYYIGRAVAGTILENYKLYKSPRVENYLNEICGTITLNSDIPVLYKSYCVAIIDTDEVNAFATSGGHILISKGLLSCANSEDAIAAVLAHEIAHIQLHHSINAIKSSRATNALLLTAQTAVVINMNDSDSRDIISGFGDTVNDIFSTLVNSGYSKVQEFDADKKALSLLNDAGYDPTAMNDMLNLLIEKQKNQQTGFSKTHPKPTERIKNLRTEFSKYNNYSDRSYREERFKKIMETL